MAKKGFQQAGNFLMPDNSGIGAALAQGMVVKAVAGTEYRWIHNNGTNSTYAGREAGPSILSNVLDGLNNAGFGVGALGVLDTSAGTGQASNNTIVGGGSGINITTGNNNANVGGIAYQTTGSNNTGIGAQNGQQTPSGGITTGSDNTLLGYNAGGSYRSSESSNIKIGSSTTGTLGQSNTLRIGNGTGTGTGQINQAIICGINGKTSSSGSLVLVNSSDVLGTTTSSIRYKENVQPIFSAESRKIHQLNPVTFMYKEREWDELCYGLIAEEVEPVLKELMVYKDGEVETLKYHFLVPLLLKELQELREDLEILKEEYGKTGI